MDTDQDCVLNEGGRMPKKQKKEGVYIDIKNIPNDSFLVFNTNGFSDLVEYLDQFLPILNEKNITGIILDHSSQITCLTDEELRAIGLQRTNLVSPRKGIH